MARSDEVAIDGVMDGQSPGGMTAEQQREGGSDQGRLQVSPTLFSVAVKQTNSSCFLDQYISSGRYLDGCDQRAAPLDTIKAAEPRRLLMFSFHLLREPSASQSRKLCSTMPRLELGGKFYHTVDVLIQVVVEVGGCSRR